MRADIIERMRRTAEDIAASSGAKATLTMSDATISAVVMNDPKLTERVLPSLRRLSRADRVIVMPLQTGAEDFAYYAAEVPGFFFFVGVTPAGTDMAKAASNHSPLFYIDEPAIGVAMRSLTAVAVDYLQGPSSSSVTLPSVSPMLAWMTRSASSSISRRVAVDDDQRRAVLFRAQREVGRGKYRQRRAEHDEQVARHRFLLRALHRQSRHLLAERDRGRLDDAAAGSCTDRPCPVLEFALDVRELDRARWQLEAARVGRVAVQLDDLVLRARRNPGAGCRRSA